MGPSIRRRTMAVIDQAILEKRFQLGKGALALCERFEKSPDMTEELQVSNRLRVTYAPADASTLRLARESFLRGYEYATEWFDYGGTVPFDLWMAPDAEALGYITCQPHDETFFCAPGDRDGFHVVLFVSPLACGKNADPERLTCLFAHEITHHLIREISHATSVSMKRREERDVPMWLEEGICQLVGGEVCDCLDERRLDGIVGTTDWYDWEDLWNDLSSCEDVDKAYLQAFEKVRALVRTRGRADIIRLLWQNRTGEVDWTNLALE
jgi:hypothetical protein